MRARWFQDDPGQKFSVPPVRTWSGANLLLVVLVLMFLLQLMFSVERFLALRISELGNPLNWYQFFTYSLLHTKADLMHLLLNGLVLFFFGRQVEVDIGGRTRFLIFAGVAALVASLSYVVVELLRSGSNLDIPMYGASGIAYAALVAFGTLHPQAQVVFFIFPMRAWALVAILMGLALYSMLMGSGGGVAHVAHLGGGAFGFLSIRYRHQIELLLVRFREQRASAQKKRRIDRRREVDRILEKISRSGIGSLTREERRFLDSASRDLRDRP